MRDPRTTLPPMNSLIIFEVAARLLSFTQAAEELTITREAVSRHIRRLEDDLGVRLFLRLHRALELTEAGRAFQGAVEEALDGIRLSARALKGEGKQDSVTILATVAISSFWLTPRLKRFRDREPDLRLRLRTSDSLPDLRREGIDVALVYGEGSWPGVKAQPLFATVSFPVCAPDYPVKAPPLKEPADLVQHTLLNLEGERHSSEDWVWWLNGFGTYDARRLQIIGFDNYATVIQAAIEGQGVALGFSRLIDDLIARGSLIYPFKASRNPGQAAYVVTPETVKPRPEVARFVEWVLEEAGG